MALQSTAATVIKDEFPVLKDWWVAAGTCVGGFFIGLVYVTPVSRFRSPNTPFLFLGCFREVSSF